MGIIRAFYPDYLVNFIDGSIGIYDTKSGITAEIEETKAKSNSLQSFVKKERKEYKTKGGIVQATHSGMYIFTGDDYEANTANDGWKRLDF